MTTSTPSHNLVEVLKAEEHLMDSPDASIEELMEFVERPDFRQALSQTVTTFENLQNRKTYVNQINKWLPIIFGCHHRPDRSFFYHGHSSNM